MTTLGGLANLKEMGAALTVLVAARACQLGNALVAITGDGINRVPAGGGDLSAQEFESCKLIVTVDHTIDAARTLVLALDPEHADPDLATDPTGETVDAATWANVPTSHQPVTTASVVGATVAAQTVFTFDLRLVELKKFMRFNLTPSIAGGLVGDIVNVQAVVVLGGAHKAITRVVSWTPNYKT